MAEIITNDGVHLLLSSTKVSAPTSTLLSPISTSRPLNGPQLWSNSSEKNSIPGNYEALIQSPVSLKTALISRAVQPDPLWSVYLTHCAIIPSPVACDDSTGSTLRGQLFPQTKNDQPATGDRIPGRKGVFV